MKTSFPASLKPTTGQKPAERRARRRLLRNAMRSEAKSILSTLNYSFGTKMDVAKGAFEATLNGKPLRISIRAGADRWLAVTQSALSPDGELAQVNELILITFADQQTRDSIQLWRFDASIVAAMGKKVFEAASTMGQQWLPLDDTLDDQVHSMAAGSLAKHGVLLAEQPVEWLTDFPETETHPAAAGNSKIEATHSEGSQFKLTIAQAKAGLAAQFSVDPDSIKITIEG